MSDVVREAQHEFWRPPVAQVEAAKAGMAEVCDVITGSPWAMASRTGMPKPSSSEGNAKMAAREYHPASAWGET